MGLIIRAETRRRWRGLVVVALFVAFGGAVTLTAAAGARRTATSFDRLEESTRNHDVLLLALDVRRADIAKIRALRDVEGVGWARQFVLAGPGGEFPTSVGPLDDGVFHDVERLHIVAGRLPRPDRPTEVVLGESLAHEAGLHAGDILPVRGYTQQQLDTVADDAPAPKPLGPALTLHVVGISRGPSDLGLQSTAGGLVLLPRAFVVRYGSRIGSFEGEHSGLVIVRLHDGPDGVHAFLPRLHKVFGRRPFDVDPASITIGGVQESIDVLAIGVLVFGAIACAASLIALGLVISRQIALAAASQTALRDLGLARRGRTAAAAGPFLLAIAGGAVLAVLGAWAASPLLPFGLAGRAEPHPGASFDVLVLLVGVVAFAAVLGVVAVVAAARDSRGTEPAPRIGSGRIGLTRLLEAAGGGPPTTIGVDMALGRRTSRGAVPVRSSIIGVAVAVFGIAAAAVFSASLTGLLDTPRAYGRSWDAQLTDPRADVDEAPCSPDITTVVRRQVIAITARLCSVNTTLDGHAVGGVALVRLRGSFSPTVLEGRAPRGAHEVALGTATLDDLDKAIGGVVTGDGPTGPVRYRIVGRVVVPAPEDAQAIADGAVFTGRGLELLDDPGNVSSSSSLVVRYRPGVDPTDATRRLTRLEDVRALNPTAPLEVERLRQVDDLPLILSAFLAVLGALALAHLLLTSVQRRRIDFAVLKVLGFRRRQFGATLAAQATTIALAGLVCGLATGALAGAFLWRITADSVGVRGTVDANVPVLVGIAIGTLFLANVLAVFPARSAARTRPAPMLHGE